MKERATYCRVCEPSCGLIAQVEDGELTGLKPDQEHPVTKGFACNKGLAGLELHRDPDRCNSPERRRADGSFEQISWQTAIAEIAERVREIDAKHGQSAFGSYIGNPMAFNALGGPATGSFLRQLGAQHNFSSGTQDCTNKFAGSEGVYGTSTCHPIPDFDHTDYLLVLGSNPQVSRMSFVSIADPMGRLKAIKARGGTVRYVNSRTIESASNEGEVVLVRPDSDVYLLAAMLCEIADSNRMDPAVVDAHGTHMDELLAFVRQYPAERVAGVVGLSAEGIRALAREFADAESASATMSTGLNMGRQGTIAYWLTQMLVFVTGNLDRRGGNLYSTGFYPDAPRSGRRDSRKDFFESQWGRIRRIRGSLPGNLIADAIHAPEEPMRALFVVSGNPILTIGGESRMREAFKKLELVVTVDLYRNATGQLADYVLPATDGFERHDVNLCGLGLQHQPFVQVAEPVVSARGERKPEWWIFAKLEQALGYRSILDKTDTPPLFSRIDHMLSRIGLSTEEVKQAKSQTVALGALEPGGFYESVIQTEDGRVDCCPGYFREEGAIDRVEMIFKEMLAEPDDQLKLISKREPSMHNSWFQNLPKVRGRNNREPKLWMHPEDAEVRGLNAGERVRVGNENGEIEVELALDAGLARGAAALPHGGGNANTPALRFASEEPGANANALLPSGPGSFEPISCQAFMTGIPIEVSPA
ncbi:MAG: molybdopterin-dependent oxidoreductase [Myxococcota bacterium]|nr:molybdopterin-dependent oxidoreductase [Myxococcota bacterium]